MSIHPAPTGAATPPVRSITEKAAAIEQHLLDGSSLAEIIGTPRAASTKPEKDATTATPDEHAANDSEVTTDAWVEDVCKAVETGKLRGLTTHAFAIEKQADETFTMMFSRHHFDVAGTPTRLSQTMSTLFSKLVAIQGRRPLLSDYPNKHSS